MGRQRKAKVGLREGGDSSAKGGGKVSRNVIWDSDWEEGSFMVVDGKTCSTFKELKDYLSGMDSLGGATDENQGVVSVLENRAWLVREDGGGEWAPL